MARTTRRDLLRIGVLLGVAGVVMARPWQGLRPPDLVFEDITELPPLRRLIEPWETTSGNAGSAVLIGLEPPGMERSDPPATLERLRQDICSVLDLSWSPGDRVPVTYFTDINCPSCRRLEANLAALSENEDVAFELSIREFPVFGPESEAAAKVIRAASAQGGADITRRHLQSRPAPDTAAEVTALASRLGLDGSALVAAWESAEVRTSLAEDRTLARLLGVPGTPSLVIGHTFVVGSPPPARLAALLRLERSSGAPARCI